MPTVIGKIKNYLKNAFVVGLAYDVRWEWNGG